LPERLTLRRAETATGGTRKVYFGPKAGWRETPILTRADLGTPRRGPCIVEEYDATCVVPPDADASLDRYGNIVMRLESAAPTRSRKAAAAVG
jgi:N-methylhydantoinase A